MASIMNIDARASIDDIPTSQTTAAVDVVSVPDMYRLLAQAAELAARANIPPQAFTDAAWQSYLQASPVLVEQMAEAHFVAALEELRESGRLPKV
jgi:hypothetical protein